MAFTAILQLVQNVLQHQSLHYEQSEKRVGHQVPSGNEIKTIRQEKGDLVSHLKRIKTHEYLTEYSLNAEH
jgi:hypothetical protein